MININSDNLKIGKFRYAHCKYKVNIMTRKVQFQEIIANVNFVKIGIQLLGIEGSQLVK